MSGNEHGGHGHGFELWHIFQELPARPSSVPAAPEPDPVEPVALTVDGRAVTVAPGETILDACAALGVETPTLCHAPNLTPVNACRVCVVEVDGQRTLAPACSRRAEPGMVVRTETERVRTARKVVLELLGSSVDLSLAGRHQPDGSLAGWMARYDADPARFGPPTAPADAGEIGRAHV